MSLKIGWNSFLQIFCKSKCKFASENMGKILHLKIHLMDALRVLQRHLMSFYTFILLDSGGVAAHWAIL